MVKRIILFGLAGLMTSTAVIAGDVQNLSDNGPLEIYLDHDETGDPAFRIHAGDAIFVENTSEYTGGDVLFEIKPDDYPNYSNLTGVGDIMTTINTDATIAGATDLNSTLTVDGAADLNSTLTVDGATTITGSITQTAGNIDFTTSSNGSISLDADGASGSIALEAGTNTSTLNLANQSITANTSGVITLTATGSSASTDVRDGTDDNGIELVTTTNSGDIFLESDDDIELDAADDIEVYAIQDLEILAVRLGGETTNTDTNDQLTGYGGILAIQGKDTNRYIADSNGKIVLIDTTDTTDDWDGNIDGSSAETVAAGTTAQLLVGDATGNMRGLVVQENKTTLSGGQNAASLTLDTRGATFSNPTTGEPIQVHGVADGTAAFDAVNVRQLYSGLAAVMAAGTPELRLEPGKSSAAFGVGHYGGYLGVGFGYGHMYDDETVVSLSVGKAQFSEAAIKANVSWTW